MNKTWIMAGLLTAVLATSALAEGPSTRPDRPRNKGEGSPGWMDRTERTDRPKRPPGGLPTSEQWQEAIQFMEKHSPKRLEMISRNPPDRLKGMIWSRYNHLKQLGEQKDTALHDIILEQVRAEDVVWGAALEWGNASQLARAEMRGKIAEAVGKMLLVRFKERELRIERLEQAIKHAQEELAADRQNIEKLTTDRVEGIIEELKALRDKRGGDGPRPPRDGKRDGPPPPRPE